MKVRVQFEQVVRYRTEIDIPKADYDKWCADLDDKRGQELREVYEDLFNACHFDQGEGDFDDPICETFESVPSAPQGH